MPACAKSNMKDEKFMLYYIMRYQLDYKTIFY